ncbi:MAG: hypothetical protein KKB89_03795 [Candidatus Omnitrophica bacterium]|nr:hypothetical protein [Candidatus Omnitrophota bacterium]
MKKKVIFIILFFLLSTSACFFPVYLRAETAAGNLPPKAEAAGEGLGKKISLNVRDMDIIEVLRFLADQGNLNVVTSQSVAGRVTLVLNNISINNVLDIIMVSNGLAYKQENGIIHIMTQNEYLAVHPQYGKKFYSDLEVKTVKFSYVKPSYAFSVLDNLKSKAGKIIIDEDSGQVVIIDTKQNIAQMEEVIKDMEYKLKTRVFSLMYAEASEIEAILKTKLDAQGVGSIQADTRSNQVIVRALSDRLKEAGEIIRKLDKKTKQVLIEARIFKLTLNPRFDMGIDWQKAFSKSSKEALRSLSLVGSFPIASGISTAAALGTVGKFSAGNISEDEFAVEVKALKQVSKVTLLANPRITVANKEEANIHIGDKLAYVTTTTTTGQTTSTTAEAVSFVDVGIKLNVIPIINDEGFVTLKIKPEISSKTGDYTTPTGNAIPLINTTQAETTVVVKDGTTIIIGGLRKNENSHTSKGIPLLMDIPVLGSLFKSKSDSLTKTEIVIFIKPQVISGEIDIIDRKPEIMPFKKY